MGCVQLSLPDKLARRLAVLPWAHEVCKRTPARASRADRGTERNEQSQRDSSAGEATAVELLGICSAGRLSCNRQLQKSSLPRRPPGRVTTVQWGTITALPTLPACVATLFTPSCASPHTRATCRRSPRRARPGMQCKPARLVLSAPLVASPLSRAPRLRLASVRVRGSSRSTRRASRRRARALGRKRRGPMLLVLAGDEVHAVLGLVPDPILFPDVSIHVASTC